MSPNFNSIKTLIESGNIKSKKIRDDTFFDIGLRGHYENPFTEVLSYLLKPESQYNNNNEFAKLFLKSLPNLNEKIIESFELEMNIETQYGTINGKYIDLFIFNSKYILVFENKIEHDPINPFEDYENDIIVRFKNLTPYYYILSKEKIIAPAKWTNVLINNTFKQIKNKLPEDLNNKWDYFVDEFLTHHIQPNKIFMTEEEMNFYGENFSTIFDAMNNFNDCILSIVDKIKNKLPEELPNVGPIQDSGKETKLVRFYPIESKEDHVMLTFESINRISINLYYFQDPKQKSDEILGEVGTEGYMDQKDRSICYYRRHRNLKFANIDEATEECCKQINLMKQFYLR